MKFPGVFSGNEYKAEEKAASGFTQVSNHWKGEGDIVVTVYPQQERKKRAGLKQMQLIFSKSEAELLIKQLQEAIGREPQPTSKTSNN